MQWEFRWVSPDPKRWSSSYDFSSYDDAVDSAIWHERNRRKRKNLYNIPPDKNNVPWSGVR